MPAERNKATDCPHNVGLVCDPCERDCKTCGWSPEVDAQRRAALRSGENPLKIQFAKRTKERKICTYTVPTLTKVCKLCGQKFETHGNRARYCPNCQSDGTLQEFTNERRREYYRRKKEAETNDKGKTPQV